jgi:aminoglycoside phosphotransferase (APT) family kinase protein
VSVDVVATAAEAEHLVQPPLLMLDRVRAFLDQCGLGDGEVHAERTGEGRSNFTFVISRGADRFVLRRPPRPPYPPSAHDMAREARLQLALAGAGMRVARVAAVCEDTSVLGVPFYVMEYVDGHVVTKRLPPPLDNSADARRDLGHDLVDTLVEIHGVDVATHALAPFRRSGDYLDRQLRRFTELWPRNATREIRAVDEAGTRLRARVPEPVAPTVVHGDFRLGNTIVGAADPRRIAAVVDWEMGAIGDPRADVGYMLATYAEPGSPPSLFGGSPATATEGFPSKSELVERYVARTGRSIDDLDWFVAFACWKAAIFCEAIYGRYVRGELAAGDDGAAFLEAGVPLIAEGALQALGS